MRRRASLRASGELGVDDRPPVLYLRSFNDDSLRIWLNPLSSPSARFDLVTSMPRRRFEEMITWQLWKVGPVFAVSQPDQHGQPVGAARERLGWCIVAERHSRVA